jgi:hypothetical protein
MSRRLRHLMFWMLLLLSGENLDERPDVRSFEQPGSTFQQEA